MGKEHNDVSHLIISLVTDSNNIDGKNKNTLFCDAGTIYVFSGWLKLMQECSNALAPIRRAVFKRQPDLKLPLQVSQLSSFWIYV